MQKSVTNYSSFLDILKISKIFDNRFERFQENYRNLFSWLVTAKDIIIANVIVMFSRGMHY